MHNRIIAFSLLLSTLYIPAAAQVRNTRDYITVRLTPNHTDWNYRTNETAEVSLSVWSVLGEKAATTDKTKKSPAKELFVVQDCAHWQYPEHRQARHRWVLSAE